MTREEVIERLRCFICEHVLGPKEIEAVKMAIAALQKENEPASPKGNTSSEENYYNKNDSTEKKKCQDAIRKAVGNMITIYERMSPEEQNAWDLGEVYKHILDVHRMIEEDK